MNAAGPLWGLRIGDRVEGPDGTKDLGEELRGIDLRARGAGVDEDDFARDRLEGGAEMPP